MALCPSARLSVHSSVRPSQVGVASKLPKISSCKQCYTIAKGLWFSGANNFDEIPKKSPATRAQMQVVG